MHVYLFAINTHPYKHTHTYTQKGIFVLFYFNEQGYLVSIFSEIGLEKRIMILFFKKKKEKKRIPRTCKLNVKKKICDETQWMKFVILYLYSMNDSM